MAISTDETGEVKFKRSTTEGINALPIENGSLIYNTENGKTYMDYNNKRIQTGGNADTIISIGENEPTDEDIIIWINNDGLNYYNEFKYREHGSSRWQDLTLPPIGDTVPIGAVMEYSGSTIPYGWESAGTGKIRKVRSLIGAVGVVSDSYSTNSEVVYNAPYINAQNGKVLWRNSKPSNSFSAQNITLTSSDYDTYEIIFKVRATNDDGNRIISGGKILKRYGTRLFVPYASEMGSLIYSRAVDYVSDKILQFYDCQYAHGTTTRITNNEYIIPLYIVGYKTNIFN